MKSTTPRLGYASLVASDRRVMETLIVYGLVLLFFVLLAIFVIAVLAVHPYAEPSATVQKNAADADSMIAYGVLAAIMTFLFVIMLLSEREHSHLTSSS